MKVGSDLRGNVPASVLTPTAFFVITPIWQLLQPHLSLRPCGTSGNCLYHHRKEVEVRGHNWTTAVISWGLIYLCLGGGLTTNNHSWGKSQVHDFVYLRGIEYEPYFCQVLPGRCSYCWRFIWKAWWSERIASQSAVLVLVLHTCCCLYCPLLLLFLLLLCQPAFQSF